MLENVPALFPCTLLCSLHFVFYAKLMLDPYRKHLHELWMGMQKEYYLSLSQLAAFHAALVKPSMVSKMLSYFDTGLCTKFYLFCK